MAHQMMLVDFASSARPTQTQKDAFVLHALESSTSEEVDMDFAIRAGNILQTLAFLSHVIRAKADDPGKVRKYANLAEEELQTLGELMRPMLWNPK